MLYEILQSKLFSIPLYVIGILLGINCLLNVKQQLIFSRQIDTDTSINTVNFIFNAPDVISFLVGIFLIMVGCNNLIKILRF